MGLEPAASARGSVPAVSSNGGEVAAPAPNAQLLAGQVQILLAEKRTSLALLRTGITVALVPLSIWTVLVATSRLYNIFQVLPLILPILIVGTLLFVIGVYVVIHGLRHLHEVDERLASLRERHEFLREVLHQEMRARVFRAH